MSSNFSCYHCALPIPPGVNYSVIIDKVQQFMCCLGCKAVAEAIIDNGLADYYHFREKPGAKADDNILLQLNNLTIYNGQDFQAQHVSKTSDNIAKIKLVIEGIHCPACVWLIEHSLKQLNGVKQLKVNLSNHIAIVEWDQNVLSLADIFKKIINIGYKAYPSSLYQQSMEQSRKNQLKYLGVSALGAMQVMMFAVALYAGDFHGMETGYRTFIRWASLVVSLPVLVVAGRPFFHSAFYALKNGRLNMDVPVSVALISAFIASSYNTVLNMGEVYYDSICMFIFFLTLGRVLESSARLKAANSISALYKITPSIATVLKNDAQFSVSTNELRVGDTVLVKRGEVIPSDGIIQLGSTSVNESLITGEATLHFKQANEAVIGGSINEGNPIQVKLTKVGKDTLLAGIVSLIEQAQMQKPKISELADKVSGYFVGLVLLFAAGVWFYWSKNNSAQAFEIMLAVLVVSCPCALSLATPVSLTVAINRMFNLGFIVTKSHVIESLSSISKIVFDKTGTLTTGKFSLLKVNYYNDATESQVKSIVKTLEKNAEHPLAVCLLDYASSGSWLNGADIIAYPGLGVGGVIDKQKYYIGNSRFMEQVLGDNFHVNNNGHNLALFNDAHILASFDLTEPLRDNAGTVVEKLLKSGMSLAVLSGDPSSRPVEIGRLLNIHEVLSAQLPEDKLNYIQNQKNQNILMIGDGINDGPVMGAATVGVAMGCGADLLKTKADAILINNDLAIIPQVLTLAKAAKRIIKQNLFWAVAYNFTALPLAACGLLAPYQAAIGMSLSSLLVVLNALRLNRI